MDSMICPACGSRTTQHSKLNPGGDTVHQLKCTECRWSSRWELKEVGGPPAVIEFTEEDLLKAMKMRGLQKTTVAWGVGPGPWGPAYVLEADGTQDVPGADVVHKTVAEAAER